MLMNSYFNAVNDLFEKIRITQEDNIIRAGGIIAEAAAQGRAVHIYDTGHIINSELVGRAGGLMLLKQFKYNLNVENPVRQRDKGEMDISMEGLAKYALRAANVLPGDIMIIGSVSGKSTGVVDLALEARKLGLTVIAVTSLTYSSAVKSDHSSGKKLFEVGDIVIDNCAPVGDAMLSVEGMEQKICPASGIAAAYLMWAISTVVIEELLQKGIIPSVYKSHNFPGGPEFNKEIEKHYLKTGI